MEDVSMDYGAVNAEKSAKEFQDELTVVERSMGNGTADADGAQARGAGRVKSIAVGIDGMEAIVVQDNGTDASHGTTMGDISMDDGAITVEGAEACQGELTTEHGSVGNGIIDANGAQARGVKGVSDVQGAQVVGGNGSMVSGSIVGAGAQLGAAESEATGATSVVEADGIPRPGHWAKLIKGQKKNWKKWHKWNGLYEPS